MEEKDKEPIIKSRPDQLVLNDASDSQQPPVSFGDFLWDLLVGDGDQSAPPSAPVSSQNISAVRTVAQEPIKNPKSVTTSLWDYLSGSTVAVNDNNALSANINTEPALNTAAATQGSLSSLDNDDDDAPVTLAGRNTRDAAEQVLTPSMAQQLRRHFPSRYRFQSEWRLLYSLSDHGISMNTLYGQLQAYCERYYDGLASQCPSVLIIKDRSGAVFGAFVSEMWRSSSGTVREMKVGSSGLQSRVIDLALMVGSSRKRSFYGTGETFLFQVDKGTAAVQKHAWTGGNDYFMLSESDFMAIGGGNGKFALYIDGDLYRGVSAATPTFANTQPLCGSSDGEFVCVGLEIWGLVD